MTEVDKDVVAQYYIECELDNIITGGNIQLRTDTYSSNMPRLLEALSFTYRANGVFDFIESGKYRWIKRIVNLNEITLTGMTEDLTKIIYSDKVQQNPLKFIEYIKSHSMEDHFNELKFKTVPQNRQTLILREEDCMLKMLDGSHRLLSMIAGQVKSAPAYVAVLTIKDAKPMIGDATFLRLRKLWQQTEDISLRVSIEETVVGMIKATSNGERSVSNYWVRMAPSDEVRAVGQLLIDRARSQS